MKRWATVRFIPHSSAESLFVILVLAADTRTDQNPSFFFNGDISLFRDGRCLVGSPIPSGQM